MSNQFVYIVICTTVSTGIMIESVWTTIELAQSAIYYHAQAAMKSPGYYSIVTRELNVTTKS